MKITNNVVRILTVIASMGIMTSPLFAHKSPHSVPQQLQVLQDTLAQMQAERAAMEVRLNERLTSLQSSANDLQGSADALQTTANAIQTKADEIFGVVTEVNIEMTTQLCFNGGAKFEGGVGIHDEVGIGWPNVLSAKAILQGEGGFSGELGVQNEICIQVPLYSVPSIHPLFTNGGEFDDLIAGLALPSQTIVPIIADVYTALMPTPDESLLAMGNVTEASTGYNVYTGIFSSPNPIALLRPDILLEPVIPQVAKDFVTYAPQALDAALADPCIALEATAFGAALRGRQDVQFLCGASAGALQTVVKIITDIANFFGI